MGLSRYSYRHISGPHEPIPTKFGLWMFFIMLHRDMVSKTLKCKKGFCDVIASVLYRPYALTSRLHNNDAVLAERIGAQPLSQCAGPGPRRLRYMACWGWPSGCMLGDGARGSATFDPQRGWAPFCDVIYIRSINPLYLH